MFFGRIGFLVLFLFIFYAFAEDFNQTNQSSNQTINQTNNQSNNQTFFDSVNLSSNQSDYQTNITDLFNQTNQSSNQTINQTNNQSNNQTFFDSVNLSSNQSVYLNQSQNLSLNNTNQSSSIYNFSRLNNSKEVISTKGEYIPLLKKNVLVSYKNNIPILSFKKSDYLIFMPVILPLDSNFFNPGSMPFSISLFFNANSAGGGTLVSKISPDGGYYISIEPFSNSIRFKIADKDDDLDFEVPISYLISDGRWHHLVAIRENNSIFLYLDNTLVGNASNQKIYYLSNNYPFSVGSQIIVPENNYPAFAFDGKIAAVQYFPFALNNQEIEKLFSLKATLEGET